MMKMMMVVVDASHLILVGVGQMGDQSLPTPVSNVEEGGHEYLEPGGHQVKKKKNNCQSDLVCRSTKGQRVKKGMVEVATPLEETVGSWRVYR